MHPFLSPWTDVGEHVCVPVCAWILCPRVYMPCVCIHYSHVQHCALHLPSSPRGCWQLGSRAILHPHRFTSQLSCHHACTAAEQEEAPGHENTTRLRLSKSSTAVTANCPDRQLLGQASTLTWHC